jgi:hypothetical protein
METKLRKPKSIYWCPFRGIIVNYHIPLEVECPHSCHSNYWGEYCMNPKAEGKPCSAVEGSILWPPKGKWIKNKEKEAR